MKRAAKYINLMAWFQDSSKSHCILNISLFVDDSILFTVDSFCGKQTRMSCVVCFFLIFVGHMSICGATDTLVLDFW